MRCLHCNHDKLKTIDTRDAEPHRRRRRKECLRCARRFTTYEYPNEHIVILREQIARLKRAEKAAFMDGWFAHHITPEVDRRNAWLGSDTKSAQEARER